MSWHCACFTCEQQTTDIAYRMIMPWSITMAWLVGLSTVSAHTAVAALRFSSGVASLPQRFGFSRALSGGHAPCIMIFNLLPGLSDASTANCSAAPAASAGFALLSCVTCTAEQHGSLSQASHAWAGFECQTAGNRKGCQQRRKERCVNRLASCATHQSDDLF